MTTRRILYILQTEVGRCSSKFSQRNLTYSW